MDEKSVPSLDEDVTTISVESAKNALKRAPQIDVKEIGAIYVGSESHPYAVKPTATIVAEAIDATPFLTAADLEFACKAATAGIQACMGLVKAGYIQYGMSIGSDTAQCRPADPLEYTAGAGGCAYIIGEEDVMVTIEGTCSYTQDIPDFWRRDGAEFPSHAGRFTGGPAYFTQIINCSRELMKRMGTTPNDYDYVVFHEPNGRFPLMVADMLGFEEKKVLPSLVVRKIGNTYSGSSLLGLAAVLDCAKTEDRIFMTSYGSGAGSDSFSMVVTDELEEKKTLAPSVEYYVNRKEYVDYALYARSRNLLRGLTS